MKPEQIYDRKCTIVLGVPVDCLTMEQALDRIIEFTDKPSGTQNHLVATLNVDFLVNSLLMFHSKPLHAELLNVLRETSLVLADGMPIVWLSRLIGAPLPERVAGSDLVPLLAERAAACGKKIYLLGGKTENTNHAAKVLTEQFPNLQIAGIDTPMVDLSSASAPETDRLICDKINKSGADILLIGFGAPKQELWFSRNREQLQTPVAIGVGGTFNFICGSVKRAPSVMRKTGAEWIYRIIAEPRRLWKRYLTGLIKFNFMAFCVIFVSTILRCTAWLMRLIGLSPSAVEENVDSDFGVRVDLKRVIYLDPDALCRMWQVSRECHSRNLNFEITGVSPLMRYWLKINRMWDAFAPMVNQKTKQNKR